jgi:hypothetical protein
MLNGDDVQYMISSAQWYTDITVVLLNGEVYSFKKNEVKLDNHFIELEHLYIPYSAIATISF